MKTKTKVRLFGLVVLIVAAAICIYDLCADGVTPLWHTITALGLMMITALAWDWADNHNKGAIQ